MIFSNSFFAIFLLTIIFTRVFLFFRPTASPTIAGIRIHHYMYGILGVFLGLLLNIQVIYTIGLALFIDELTYIIIGGKNHKDNYSKLSLFGTFVFVIVVFLLRNKINLE